MVPTDSLAGISESYYLETVDGLFFAVKGLEHPDDRIIAVLRYAPDPEKGTRTRGAVRYRRLYHFKEQEDLLLSCFPQYLAFDDCFQATLQSVPVISVRRVYDPVLRLQEMMRSTAAMPLEADAADFCRLLQRESGVPFSAIGVSGSLLIGLHTQSSDMDLSVFGDQNCRKVYAALRRLQDSGSVRDLCRMDGEEMEALYAQRISDTPMAFAEFAALERMKVCQGSYRGCPYFIRFIKHGYESGESYGRVRYSPVGRAIITATIADDTESIFTPCRYAVSNVHILEGPALAITEITSFRGRFCEQSSTGTRIRAAGSVERLENADGQIRYRLLLGGSQDDTMVPAG